MEATKVIIRDETRRFYERPLSRKERRKLREAAIIALIDSRPAGSRIKEKEFASVAQTSLPTTHSLLLSMVRQQKIGRVSITPRTYSWFTHSREKTVKPPASVQTEPAANPVPPPVPHPEKITDLARTFAWDYNSDSLREFIKYLGERGPQ